VTLLLTLTPTLTGAEWTEHPFANNSKYLADSISLSVPLVCVLSHSINIKLTIYKALIRIIMFSVCPTCDYAADAYFFKLQGLQNPDRCATGNFNRRASVREFHLDFKIPYVYNYVKKLCRKQAEAIQNHLNPNLRAFRQEEAQET
jgi:hypothetical protein